MTNQVSLFSLSSTLKIRKGSTDGQRWASGTMNHWIVSSFLSVFSKLGLLRVTKLRTKRTYQPRLRLLTRCLVPGEEALRYTERTWGRIFQVASDSVGRFPSNLPLLLIYYINHSHVKKQVKKEETKESYVKSINFFNDTLVKPLLLLHFTL